MASPFAMFRRNQQTLLVVLFILAIFAFTLSDLLTSQTVNLPMLGLIIGTCIMTAVGAVMKQPAKYAAIGALGGLLVGTTARMFVTPNAPDAVATTKLGAVTRVDVQRIVSERNTANKFISFAAQEAVGPQEARQLIATYSFNIPAATTEEEAVLSLLLLDEAKRLGIYIDKTAVSDYINRATQNKLSKTAYNDIIRSIQIADGHLYQILQEQIAIKTAQEQLAPARFIMAEQYWAGFMTPEQYWEMYKKLNFRQRIQTVGIPVATLAKDIPKPDESELQAFFEVHKNNFPGQPRLEAINLEHLGLTVDNLSEKSTSQQGLDITAGAQVTRVKSDSISELRGIKRGDVIVKVNDDEIRNKVELEDALKNLDPASRIKVTVRNANGSRSIHLEDLVGFRQPRKIQLAYIEANYLDLEATVDEITDQEIEDHYEEFKDPLYLNRRVPDDALGGGDPFLDDSGGGTTGPDLGQPNTPSPKLDFDSLFPDTPPDAEAPLKADKPGASAPQSSEEKGQTPEQPELPQIPNPGDKPESNQPDSQSRIDRASTRLQSVSFVQEEKETEKTEKQQTQADTEKTEAKAAESQESETAEESPDKPSESETESPDSKTAPPAPETDLEAPLKAPRPEPPKYRPLDDLLRDEIRDTLLRQRTRDEQERLAKLVLDRMSALSDEYFKLEKKEDKQAFVKRAQQELQELAQKHGLSYGQTPLMDFSELNLSDEYPIGSATIGMEQSNTSRETVAEHVFKMPAESVYEANAARSPDPDSIYVFWKTADRKAHVPSWDEKGIEDAVLEAWRMEQARPLAAKRAEDIKEKLEGTDETWSEYLIENPETISGEKDGVLLQPLISDSFSWMSVRSVPIMPNIPSFTRDIPELTNLSTVEGEGPEFMETVFDEMQQGDVGVVPNRDHSVYYVVQIRDRQPSTSEGRQIQLERFLSTDLFRGGFAPTPYMQLVGDEGGELYRAWLDDLKRKYDVKMVARAEQE